jgi:hypothetical protein
MEDSLLTPSAILAAVSVTFDCKRINNGFIVEILFHV